MICIKLTENGYVEQFSHGVSSVAGYINIENPQGYTADELLYCQVVERELVLDVEKYEKSKEPLLEIPVEDEMSKDLKEIKEQLANVNALLIKALLK